MKNTKQKIDERPYWERTELKKVSIEEIRPALEKAFGADLSGFEFWYESADNIRRIGYIAYDPGDRVLMAFSG